MRRLLLTLFLTICFMPGLAGAESAVATHGPPTPAAAAPAAAPAAPAKPQATIIPGSPLAVLTGASPPTPPATAAPIDTASPFGSGSLGLSLTSVIGADSAHTLDTFAGAVQQSTRLTPVVAWVRSVIYVPERRAHARDILRGLGLAVLPALLAEALIRYGLRRPREAVAARAGRQLPPAAPPAQTPDEAIASAEAGETEKRPRRRRVSFLAWLRRVGRGLVHLLLSLLPLVGFVLVSGVILGTGFVVTRQSRLAVIVVCNAYLVCRLILELLRFLLAPGAPTLRLVLVSNTHAGWIVAWVRLVLFTAAFGYAAISIFEILGLTRVGMMVLVRLVALAVHLEVAMMVWRSRRVVGRWLAGDPQMSGLFALARRRFASVWHYFALFYILALWICWAGGVRHAFGLLLRLVLVTIGVAIGGRLAWSGSLRLLEHLFPDTAPASSRRATFYARARAYNPLIRIVLQVIIVVGCVIVVLQGWGLGTIPWLLHDKISHSLIDAFFAILVTIAVALTIWETAMALLHGRIQHFSDAGESRRAARLTTLLPMLQAVIGVPIALVAGLVCLSKIGVNAAPLLAGAGVVGIAIGFGSQKLVQDIITGLFLLLEDAVQVGDVVNLAGMQGTVERLSIRTIRLRGSDGSMNIIPFSAVTTVTNLTRDFGFAQISIQVGYEEDLPRVYAILDDIAKEMRAEPRWGAMIRDDLQIFGLDQFGASALVITGQIRTGPGQHWAVRREFNARVKQRFEAEHIDIPYAYLPPGPPPKLEAPVAEDKPPAEQPAGGKS